MIINGKVDVMSIKMVCDDILKAFNSEMWNMNEHSCSYDLSDARYELFLTGSHIQSIVEYWLTYCNCHGFSSEASELIEFRDHCFQQIILYYKAFSKNLPDKVI